MIECQKRLFIIHIRNLISILICKTRNQIIEFFNSNIHAPIFLFLLLIFYFYLLNLQIQNPIRMFFLNKHIRKLRICFALFIFQLSDILFQSVNFYLSFQNIVLCTDRTCILFVVFDDSLQFYHIFICLNKLIMISISLFLYRVYL